MKIYYPFMNKRIFNTHITKEYIQKFNKFFNG